MGITLKKVIKTHRKYVIYFRVFPGTTDQILHTGNITQCPLSIYEKKLWGQI